MGEHFVRRGSALRWYFDSRLSLVALVAVFFLIPGSTPSLYGQQGTPTVSYGTGRAR